MATAAPVYVEVAAAAVVVPLLAVAPVAPEATEVLMVVTDAAAVVLAAEALPVEPLAADAEVAAEVAWEIKEDATPLPLPWDGDSPTPPVAKALVATEAADEEMEEATDDASVDEALALLVLEVVTLEQDKSNSGVVLRVEPTMPKDGFGVLPAVSWRVYQ